MMPSLIQNGLIQERLEKYDVFLNVFFTKLEWKKNKAVKGHI